MGRAGGEDGVWFTRGLLQDEDKAAAALLVLLTIPTPRLDPRVP